MRPVRWTSALVLIVEQEVHAAGIRPSAPVKDGNCDWGGKSCVLKLVDELGPVALHGQAEAVLPEAVLVLEDDVAVERRRVVVAARLLEAKVSCWWCRRTAAEY